MDFSPEIYQHSAGLTLYYDNMNYLFLHKTWDEASGAAQLAIIYMDNGERHDDPQKIRLAEGEVYLAMAINGREIQCSWSVDGEKYQNIGAVYDTSHFPMNTAATASLPARLSAWPAWIACCIVKRRCLTSLATGR
jgi:xylan 1,4-beta-xylosidase